MSLKWAPLQDFPIFTTQLCKTSPQQPTSTRHKMDYHGHYRHYGHLVLEICSASNSRIFAKIALPPMKKVGRKIDCQNFETQNPPVASINGWLQCPWSTSDIHATSETHSKHLSPRPNLAKAQAKTEICKRETGETNENGTQSSCKNRFREVKGRESLTHFKTPRASSEVCYMEWWHVPTESSTGSGKPQEINWHKQRLRLIR